MPCLPVFFCGFGPWLYSVDAPRPTVLPGRRAQQPQKAESIPWAADPPRRAEIPHNVRRALGSQPVVEQLSRLDDPSPAPGTRPRGDEGVWGRIGVGEDDRRDDGDSYGTGTPPGRIQEG